MFILSVIVLVAVGVAAVSPLECGRPRSTAVLGGLCMLVGTLAAALATDAWCTPVLAAAESAAAEETPTVDTDTTDNAAANAAPAAAGEKPEQQESARGGTSKNAPLAAGSSSVQDIPLPHEVAGSNSSDSLPAAGELAISGEPVKRVTQIRYLAANRPVWLDRKPLQEGDRQLVSVKAGPYFRLNQCAEDLDEEIKDAAAQFINDYLGTERAATLVSYRLPDIKNRLVKETFDEQLETSVGPMNQSHALIVFDRSFLRELDQRWKQIKAMARLLQVVVGSGVVLLFLTTLFGYFRLDTATRGYYTGRLQFMAAAVILLLVATSVVLVKWIPWM